MNLCFGCYDPFQNVIYWMKQRLFPCRRKSGKAIVIRICIIIPIIVSELAYRISSGAICNSFCTVCWCCIFYSENTCVIINLIFCHLLVGFKSITGNDFVFLFNADKFVRIDPFLFSSQKSRSVSNLSPLWLRICTLLLNSQSFFSRSNRLYRLLCWHQYGIGNQTFPDKLLFKSPIRRVLLS